MTPTALRWHKVFEQAVIQGMDEHAAECEADRLVPEYRTCSMREAVIQDMAMRNLSQPGHAPLGRGHGYETKQQPGMTR